MTVAGVADAHQRRQASLATSTAAFVLDRWAEVDPDDVIGSWSRALPAVTTAVEAAQQAAARRGAAYTAEVAAEQGVTVATQVNTASLSGVASDGRPLESLLGLPASQTVERIAKGIPVEQALRYGRFASGMLASTQVHDAGRLASSVAMVDTRSLTGYRRQLRGQTNCARCVVLAGKWYRWNDGFRRHPRCDCVHVPSAGPKSAYQGTRGFDPNAYFESLSEAEQEKVFTKAGAKAIRDGADLNQVVNARRGMRTTTVYGKKVKTTYVGTSTRSQSGRRLRDAGASTFQTGTANRVRRVTAPRLMPEAIYSQARDRDDAIRLLRRFGFIN